MTEYSGWIMSITGVALITVVPFLVVGEMKRRGSSLAYPIWFTAGSSAGGYSLLITGAMLEEPVGASIGAKLLFGAVWWIYLGIVSEGIASSWAKTPKKTGQN